jgi:hypothetical protein
MDILLQAKGITGIESTQIRWFSQWSGGGGWSSRAKLRVSQESQTKGQGTVRLPPQWATKAASRGAKRPNKEFLSHQFTERNRAQSSSDWKHCRAKSSPPKKAQRLKKGKTLTLCSKLEVAGGCDIGGDEVDDDENQKSQSQVHVTVLWCLILKRG